jgi:hypothetical protein
MGEHGELGTAAVVAILISEVIEMCKRFGWCPLDYDTAKLNRIVGAAAAMLTGIGLNMSFEPATGTLVVSGLVLSSLMHGVAQWCGQMAYYRLAIKPTQGEKK